MLKKWEVVLPGLTGKRARNAYIWLPDCYDEDDVRRYPVLYLFDGHNTFVDGEATYGKSWGLASYLTWTKKPCRTWRACKICAIWATTWRGF